jgi:hypothetical protein
VVIVDVLSEEVCLLLWIPPLLQEIITRTCDVSKINKTSSPPNLSVKLLKTAVKRRRVPLGDNACDMRMLHVRMERMIGLLGVKNNFNADIVTINFSKTPVNGESICRIFNGFVCTTTDKFGVAEPVTQLSVTVGKLCKSLHLIAMYLCANLQPVTSLLAVLVVRATALFCSSDVAKSIDNRRSYNSGFPETVVR